MARALDLVGTNPAECWRSRGQAPPISPGERRDFDLRQYPADVAVRIPAQTSLFPRQHPRDCDMLHRELPGERSPGFPKGALEWNQSLMTSYRRCRSLNGFEPSMKQPQLSVRLQASGRRKR